MLPSMDSLDELKNFQEWCECLTFWGLIFGGVALAILGPVISSFRSKVESRITVLESTEAADTQKKRADRLEKQLKAQQSRAITPAQRVAIKGAINGFPGQKITVACLTWDLEASRYAQDFVAVFNEAGWQCGPVENFTFPMDFHNTQVNVHTVKGLKEVPKAATALQSAMFSLGLARDDGFIHFNDTAKPGEIFFKIGAKPPLEPEESPTSTENDAP